MNTDQIAAEAWATIKRIGSWSSAIIKTAIEKATEEAYQEGKRFGWIEGREHERKCGISNLSGDGATSSPSVTTKEDSPSSAHSRAAHARDAREHRMKSAKPGQNESET